MAVRSSRHPLVAALGLALACDSGHWIETKVTLPDEVAAAYTMAQRGLVVVNTRDDLNGREQFIVGVVCGEGDTYRVSTGGLGELPCAEAEAWIEALPADDERPCGKFASPKEAVERHTLDADEPQGRASSERSDGRYPDSGSVTIEVTIEAP